MWERDRRELPRVVVGERSGMLQTNSVTPRWFSWKVTMLVFSHSFSQSITGPCSEKSNPG